MDARALAGRDVQIVPTSAGAMVRDPISIG
jgi:hypothetical protein